MKTPHTPPKKEDPQRHYTKKGADLKKSDDSQINLRHRDSDGPFCVKLMMEPNSHHNEASSVDTAPSFMSENTSSWKTRHAAKKRRKMLGITPPGMTDLHSRSASTIADNAAEEG